MLNISTHPLHQLTNDIYKCRKQSISINDKLFKQLNQLHFDLIITNAIFSYAQAINDRFKLGEPAIYSDLECADEYDLFLYILSMKK
jgi:hypothetical protein